MISRSNERGFTLLELIAVLFILAMASSIVGLAVGRSIDKAALREEAVRIQNTLRYAREISLMERLPVSFILDADQGMYWIEKKDERFGRTITIPEGMKVEGPETVFFLPKGQSTGGKLMIWDKQKRGYAVEVDQITGEARLTRLQSS